MNSVRGLAGAERMQALDICVLAGAGGRRVGGVAGSVRVGENLRHRSRNQGFVLDV